MYKRYYFLYLLLIATTFSCTKKEMQEEVEQKETTNKYQKRGWNILSNHKKNGLRTLDSAAAYGVNYVELSHYQLIHDLKDLRIDKKRDDANFFVDEIQKRGMKAFFWDHAFYKMDYYPDRFKVEAKDEQDLTHHTKKFEGGVEKQLNLDDPEFWQWVYQDYDSLLALSPNLDGVTLTFIETGSYVIYQHSDVLKTSGQKLAALVDSLGSYFIDQKGLDLHIRTFIYNQFEREGILEALQLIKRKDIHVMIKMVPHDWFMSYPYQDYVADIPFPVIIEYDGGMEYAGENIIANPFVKYFSDAFKFYNQYENVVGYCSRTDRFEETAAVGTSGEINMYALSKLVENPNLSPDEITNEYLSRVYGAEAAPILKPAFDDAWEVIMASMYTLGTHTANHSRLNLHRANIYQTHTTGEWYAPNDQMQFVGHGVNKELHNYKDVINTLAFPTMKQDIAAYKKDIGWVLDSAWITPEEEMTLEYLKDIQTEKRYAVDLARKNLEQVNKALPLVQDTAKASNLYHTFNRTVIYAEERKAVAEAVYGYRLWTKGKEFQTPELQKLVREGLQKGDSLISLMENYPVHVPLGQWRWHRDREEFEIYRKAITETGWEAFGYRGIVVPAIKKQE